ncbi:MAG: PhoH family protein [Erysipelotrichaceae bacterium]|nr:PhoH family protein [Erysipelotrichaceae bacterium]
MEYSLKDLSAEQIQNIIGLNDANLLLLEELYDCGIVFRDDCLKLLSDDEELSVKFERQLDGIVRASQSNIIDRDLIKQSFIDLKDVVEDDYKEEVIAYAHNGKPYRCKTYNQYRFVKDIERNDLVFCLGPAGTGKTFLAVLMAVTYLKKDKVKKIIITRPAVEAGESLGFLPGDLKEKVDPYLMPIYDALDAILGSEQKEKLIEKGIIEVIPLAYMRGRTLDEAFVILDEAQNTTDKQMLMFLTRLGFSSKMIVNGDPSQIDLNIARSRSGLILAKEKLADIRNIAVIEFGNDDVVRNPLVQTIIERFRID